MLQFIREKAQGWISWIIIGLLSITFMLWGIENYSDTGNKQDLAATVNGVPVTRSAVHNKYLRLQTIGQTQAHPHPLDEKEQARLKEQALQELIQSQVLAQASITDGFYLSPRLLGQAVVSMPYFQKKGRFSNERYEDILARLGYSRASFLAELEQTIVLSQIKFGIVKSAFVLPNEDPDALKQETEMEYALYIKSKMNKAVIVKYNPSID